MLCLYFLFGLSFLGKCRKILLCRIAKRKNLYTTAIGSVIIVFIISTRVNACKVRYVLSNVAVSVLHLFFIFGNEIDNFKLRDCYQFTLYHFLLYLVLKDNIFVIMILAIKTIIKIALLLIIL
jgi:hypothetical protein